MLASAKYISLNTTMYVNWDSVTDWVALFSSRVMFKIPKIIPWCPVHLCGLIRMEVGSVHVGAFDAATKVIDGPSSLPPRPPRGWREWFPACISSPLLSSDIQASRYHWMLRELSWDNQPDVYDNDFLVYIRDQFSRPSLTFRGTVVEFGQLSRWCPDLAQRELNGVSALHYV